MIGEYKYNEPRRANIPNTIRDKVFETYIVNTLSDILQQLCDRYEKDPTPPKSVNANKFHAHAIPKISIQDYLNRIERYSLCSKECFVIALLYIDRFIHGIGPTVSYNSIHRVLITAIMLAAKFYDDQYFNNAYYAKIGGLDTAELNTLEAEFVLFVKFVLNVEEEEMIQYYKELNNHFQTYIKPKISDLA